MNLCGVIRNPSLRERLAALGSAAGWTTWLVEDVGLLQQLLASLSPPPDAVLSDDAAVLAAVGHGKSVPFFRLLLIDDDAGMHLSRSVPLSAVLRTDVDDVTLVQQLQTCINARRFHDHFDELDKNEPITSLPHHEELIDALENVHGQPLGLVILHVDHAEHLYENLDPVSKTDLLHALGEHLQAGLPAGARAGFYDAACFVITLAGDAVANLAEISREIAANIRKPMRYRGGEIHLTVSAGFASTDRLDAARDASGESDQVQGVDTQALWDRAWDAMIQASEQGGDRVSGPNQNALSQQIPGALQREEFSLALQAQWDITGQQLRGAEALLRWQGMEVGDLAPSHFIPIAESHGHMARIGDWVLERACQEAVTWYQQRVAPLTLGINISPQQFHKNAISAQIQRYVESSWLDPSMLELELTHEHMLQIVDDYRDQLYKLRDRGVRFALDNLGHSLIDTGKLLRCPADTLKIDRELVAGVTMPGPGRELVARICALGERFKLRVVAVGVETEEQRAELEALGCTDAQGYLLSSPVPLEDFHQFMILPLAASTVT